MARGLGLAVALVLRVTPTASALSGPTGKLIAGAEETVLRLHDLPPGYMIEGDSGCEALESDEASEHPELQPLYKWLSFRPGGCDFTYERRFRVPGYEAAPREITTEIINSGSADAAAQGLAMFLQLIPRVTEWQRQGTTAVGSGGPTATLFHLKESSRGGRKVSLLLWRHDKLLAAIEVGGMKPEENDSAVLHYAQVQQQRLESPSPYTEAERDDTEVVLDDPSLKLPVYWLGRMFKPKNGPSSAEVVKKDGLPGTKLELRYDGSGPYSESLRGMKTVLRGLTLRPKPVYSAAP